MKIALLDSDIIAYVVASRAQETFDFGDQQIVKLDKASCWKWCDEIIQQNTDAVGADQPVICLSDPDNNFRKQYDPTYKSNRIGTVKPELLHLTKEYMYENYRSYIRPRLEADDVMGILATRPSLLGKYVDSVVIVSEDKDMRTIPAPVYNPNYPHLGILEITPLEAKQFHMWQTIVGDPTDGYPGAKGVGAGGPWDPDAGAFKLGPRSLPYAHDVLCEDEPLQLWDTVLLAFASVGLTEEDAIRQARLARILQADDYNFKTHGIRLWNPTRLFW